MDLASYKQYKPTRKQRRLGLPGPFPLADHPREIDKRLPGHSPLWVYAMVFFGGVGVLAMGIYYAFWLWWMVQRQIFQQIDQAIMIPLVIIGCGVVLVGGSLFRFLQGFLLSPVELVLSVHPLCLGEFFTVHVRLRFKRTWRVRWAVLGILCEEHTEGKKDSQVGMFVPLEETKLLMPPEQLVPAGTELEETIRFLIPRNAMHTFVGKYNEVLWELWLQIKFAGLPQLRIMWPLLVLPRRAPQEE